MTDYARGRADALREVTNIVLTVRSKTYSPTAHIVCDDIRHKIEALAQQPHPPLDEAEALIDEAYDERDKWLFKYRDAVRLIMEINQFLASKGIVHPTKLSNQIISTIKDATEHIGSLAQQPQTEPERTCGTCRYGDPLPSRCDLYWHNNCGNSEVGFPHHQPKEGA